MMRVLRWAGLCLLLASLPVASLMAQERILSYHSEISIAVDGSMDVVETIEVRAAGQQVRRGIYRDFPTDYRDRYGNRVRVGFTVVAATRDGQPEAWREESRGNGVRVYLGRTNTTLPPGDYRYEIHYRTTRQLGFFEQHDELYWNVTGNGWSLAIDQASARVSLPQTVATRDLLMEGYTGVVGSRDTDYGSSVAEGQGSISTTGALPPGSGLTLVFSFPKGVVTEPTRAQKARWLLQDNIGLGLALLVVLGNAAWLTLTWHRYGRDPEPGPIFPHYEPPKGLSPASARYIWRMRYDSLGFTAALVNLAVKGHLRIEAAAPGMRATTGKLFDKTNSGYSVERLASDQPMAAGEQAVLDVLFNKQQRVELKQDNHALLQTAMLAHARSLKRDYYGLYFKTNGVRLLPSLIATALFTALLAKWELVLPAYVFALILVALLHLGFLFLMPAPSAKGRDLLDRLEGFRDFLNVAEKEDLQRQHPPELTPELFEAFLPYAIALNVEQAWARRFTAVFEALEQRNGEPWTPSWHSGSFHAAGLGLFAAGLGASFSQSISAASNPPGSSSGSGGGGSSGGGGGGGGGGGW